MKIAVIKKLSPTFTIEEKALMEGLCNAMFSLLTKTYELHMIDFLIDSQNHFGMRPADFQNWEGRVLLILSDDDHTFNQPCKYSLI